MSRVKFDSLFGFLTIVLIVAGIWFGGRWIVSKFSSNADSQNVANQQLVDSSENASPRIDSTDRTRNQGSKRGKPVKEILATLPPSPILIGDRIKRLEQYAFYCYPPESLDQRLGEKMIVRKGPHPKLRKAIIERDGHKCLLCGEKAPLEIDHMCALMNGGDNSVENFATLCAGCNRSAMKTVDNAINKARKERLEQRKKTGVANLPPADDVIAEAIERGIEKAKSR